jgi:phage shock protein A
MARRLRMSTELSDWLTELSATEPASAAAVGAGVVAALGADDLAGIAIVRRVAAEPADPREAADQAYADMLEALQQVRREVAAVASVRRQRAAALDEAVAAGQAGDVRAQLRLTLAEAEHDEQELAARSERLQRAVDSFRVEKEVAKATYTAADATLRIYDVHGFASDEASTDRDEQVAAARARLDAAADALRRLARLRSAAAVADLLELRTDALDRDVRLVMAVEPAGTLTLLAVLDGAAVVAEHYSEAVRLASDLLADICAGDWPPANALGPADLETTFADAAAFLARFFPAAGDAVERRAAHLTAARTLADLRTERGISIEDLAVETGISAERLQRIERDGLRVAHVHEVAACIRVFGGRLRVTADLDDSARLELT